MKGGYAYTIVFMFVISAVFTLVLAATNAWYLPVIHKNEVLAQNKSVLYSLGVKSSDGVFGPDIKEVRLSGTNIYVKYDSFNKVQAYAIPFSGSGLWGTIKGYLAVSSDFKKIVGVDFTSHSETPGLGGRIDEQWFKEQFRGLTLETGKQLAYKSEGDGKVDAITGATVTSNSVLQILNNLIKSDLSKLEVKQ